MFWNLPGVSLAFVLAVVLAAKGQEGEGGPPPAPSPSRHWLGVSSLGAAAATLADLRSGSLCASGAPRVPVVELTISEANTSFLAGRLNCSSLVQAYMQRIEAFDQRLRLNSVRALAPDAMDAAARLDGLLGQILANASSAGAPSQPQLPPLFCVPLLVKDNFDVVGLATTAGTAALLDNLPREDASVIQKLKQQGAIVLGKTNMGEFAFFPSFTLGSLFGAVRNPYHLHHTPAGSSGGSAAAVAASFSMCSLGTDTGNSVRGPASHTGLVGLRPSLGLTSRAGIVPLRMDRDTAGPLARTVEDAVRVFQAMVGPDPADIVTGLMQNVSALPADYTQFLDPGGLKGARVGVLRQISKLPGAHASIQNLFEQALKDLQEGGATLVEDFRIQGNRYGRDWDANLGGLGPALGHWDVGGRWEDLWGCQAPLRVGLDAYLAASNTTKLRSLREIYQAGAYHPETGEELQISLQAKYSPEGYPTPSMRKSGMICGCSYFWTDPCRVEFRQAFMSSMDRERVDAVVFPTWNRPPLLVGASSDGYDGNNSPMIAPQVGAPAITVPMGQSVKGLPAGLQFVARPFDEPTLFKLAYANEQLTQHRQPPALFPECREARVTPMDRAATVAG